MNRTFFMLRRPAVIVGVLLIGCIVTLLYWPSLSRLVLKENVQNAGESQDQRGNSQRNKKGSSLQTPKKENKPVVPPPVTTKYPGKPQTVKDVLQFQKPGNSWHEDKTLKNLRTYGVVENVPDLDVLNTYDVKQLGAIYHSYLDNTDIRCRRKLRMGKVGDGGWEICDDYDWRPIRPCVIYSFGIMYDFSFDDDAGRIYGCDVFSFDPSMSRQPTYRRSDQVMFYRLGIGGKSREPEKTKKGWVLHSLSHFRAMLNHTNTTIDVLKMDVESSEWKSLATMLKEKQLGNVRQFLVEYHQVSDDIPNLRSHLKIIGDLEREGFRKFYVHKNHVCRRKAVGIPIDRTSCYEVHYVNAKFRRG